MTVERNNLRTPPPIPMGGGRSAPSTGAWSAPFVAPLLRQRLLSVTFAVVGFVQMTAALLNAPGLPCPMLHTFGIPCPGCGASRACGALLRGDYRHWLAMHAMAPLFLLALLMFVAAAVLPTRPRDRLAACVECVERRSGLSQLLLLALVLYWLARLLYAPRAFSLLMRG